MPCTPLLFPPLPPPDPLWCCGASQRALFHAMLLTPVHVRRTPYELFTGFASYVDYREFIIRRFFLFFFFKKNVGTNQQRKNPAEHVERGGWFAPPRKNQKVKICDYDRGGGGEGEGWGMGADMGNIDNPTSQRLSVEIWESIFLSLLYYIPALRRRCVPVWVGATTSWGFGAVTTRGRARGGGLTLLLTGIVALPPFLLPLFISNRPLPPSPKGKRPPHEPALSRFLRLFLPMFEKICDIYSATERAFRKKERKRRMVTV